MSLLLLLLLCFTLLILNSNEIPIASPDSNPDISDIMHARRIVLVAKGANKADIVQKMLYGPVTTDVPASILQLHPQCEFLLDDEAAKYVKH